MKKKHLKVLKLAKKSISNLSMQKIGGRIAERSKYGGATCLVCPTFNGGPGCPSFDCDMQEL